MTSAFRGAALRVPGSAPAAILLPGAAGCGAVVAAANDSFARLLGRPLDAVLDRPLAELLPKGDQAKLAGLAAVPGRLTLAGTELRAERIASRAAEDGLLLLSAPGDGGPGQLDPLPVAAFLAETEADGFRFVEANRHFTDYVGAVPSGLAGARLQDVLPPARAAALTEALEAAVRMCRPTTWRDVVELPSGFRHWETRLVPLAAGGSPPRVLGVSLDVTGEVAAEMAQRDAEQRLQTVFEQAAVGMAFATSDGRLVDANPSLAAMLGQSREALHGRTVTDLLVPEERGRHAGPIAELLDGRTRLWREECQLLRADGPPLWARINGSVVGDGTGRPRYAMLVFEDVNDIRRAEEQLQYLAHYDHATGLPNLALFDERAATVLEHAAAAGHEAALLAVGFDRLPALLLGLDRDRVNALLRGLAERLRDALAPGDQLGRLTEALFGIVLADAARAAGVAGSIVADFSSLPPDEDGGPAPNPLVGIARFPRDGTTPTALIRAAGAALQRARNEAGGAIAFHEPGPGSAGGANLSLEGRLRRAIERDEFELAYQPKVTVAGLDLAGFEALVRWHDPEHGMVPPSRFIPVAEETGLIEPLGELVIEKACRRFAGWRRDGLLDVPVSVNLSARQLVDPGLARKILTTLARTGLPAEGFKLELTESALFGGNEGVREPFLLLHAAGVGFMLDDFGTGYSSLSYLKRFPIEAIKIDRSFIHSMVQDPDAASIVQAMVSMAHALKMTVVAEGVETQEQLIFLRAYRCDRLQGYLIAPPLTEAEVEDRLRGRAARLGAG